MIAPEQWPSGTPVEIVAGMAKAKRGVIQRPADWRFGEQPQWFVRFEGELAERPIRQDFLRRLP